MKNPQAVILLSIGVLLVLLSFCYVWLASSKTKTPVDISKAQKHTITGKIIKRDNKSLVIETANAGLSAPTNMDISIDSSLVLAVDGRALPPELATTSKGVVVTYIVEPGSGKKTLVYLGRLDAKPALTNSALRTALKKP